MTSAAETRRYVDATCDSLRSSLRDEIASSAAETRRHFDVVAEAIRDDIRIFAEALASHSDRPDKHDMRIGALEARVTREQKELLKEVAVIVDAKDTTGVAFYLRYGFIPFPDQPLRLFLPMKTVAQLAKS